MFTRLYHSISLLFSRAKKLIVEYIENKIQAKLMSTGSENVHIVRIAPRIKIAIINPDKIQTNTARKLLAKIMPAKDTYSRNSYDFLSFYTGVIPFLSMPDDKALPIRKKRIVPYIHAMFTQTDFADEMRTLMTQLHENSNQKSNTDVIRDHFLSLFTRSMVGMEFPTELKVLLLNIESLNTPFYGLAPDFAKNLFALIPSVKKTRKKYDTAIRNFLVDAMKKMQHSHHTKKNFLKDILLEKAGENITEEKLYALADDPEIRLCVAIVLGTSNLTNVMKSLMLNLQSRTMERLIIEMYSEISVIDHVSSACLLNKIKMPLLHATYLESLRFGLKGFGINRNIQSEIQMDDVYIPSHSHVIFPLDASSHMEHCLYKVNEFWPERFLNSEGELRQDRKLHEGLFTPFGVGIRMCPGHHIAELMIKIYLVTLLNAVKDFKENDMTFYDEKVGDTARNRGRPLLKKYIKFSLFNSKSSLSDGKIAENIAENIAGYCF